MMRFFLIIAIASTTRKGTQSWWLSG